MCRLHSGCPLVWKTWKYQGIWQLSGKCQGFYSKSGKCQGKILSGKSGLKPYIVSCIFASILDFAQLVHFIFVSDHALLHSYLTTDNNTSTMVPTVRGGQGKSGSFKKSGKVMESQVKRRGSGNFITVARKKSIIVLSVYILALKSDIWDVRF